MSQAALESLGGGRFRLSGTLNAASVVSILKESRSRFAGWEHLDIDLEAVTQSDSAGLALLLEWLRLARTTPQVIHYRNLPPQISALARISEVEDLFAVIDDAATAESAAGIQLAGSLTTSGSDASSSSSSAGASGGGLPS